MTDTAQPMAAETDPNAQLAAAADVFKAFTTGEPAPDRPRDEQGRFAPQEPVAEEIEPEEAPEGAEAEPIDDDEDEQDAAEQAQPLPPSWPEDQAEQWSKLPAETQAFLAAREAERERAVQAKFQESANARKAAEVEREQANATRSQLSETLDVLAAAINPIEPDPRAFGYGTQQYNEAAYNLALHQYREQQQAVEGIKAQKAEIAKQEAEEANRAWLAEKAQVEEQFQPKLLESIPDLKDPAKGEPILHSIIDYAIQNGLPASAFAPEEAELITSAHLLMIWKAQQFDKLRETPAQPKPKPANPAVKPGVSSPRSATKQAQRQRIQDRLAREGSIDAGAAMFKSYFSGR